MPLSHRTHLSASRVQPLQMQSPEPGASDDGGVSVDWDSAWREELDKRKSGTANWRPEGREAVSEQDVLKARIQTGIDDASLQMNVLTKSWQFWIAVILALSLLTAALGQPSEVGYTV
eukprot:CAMPEP_0119320506 /NCGR_PEP_ID=MMETSP1333-20130426/52646_1 /TAXON_ID=418940 /ORGANISM="Scyphosphaera apsteinii, Strain RCC1455" /LENGTH=117 /DNA_ID=CAMNT_0007327241 /DNA_START=87 /DNA_END=440 /DNA_ORIENTATION=-